PKELERVCLKCLSKRMSDRPATALDLAEDLRGWLAAAAAGHRARTEASPAAAAAATVPGPAAGAPAEPGPPRIPQGLRAFDGDDSEFFLGLLPGPRDRGGLPESIRSWKARIEPRDGERAFSVGLLYGSSGCGKSSLVRAGLLPRLAGHVVTVYL